MNQSDKYILKYAIGYLKWLLPYAAIDLQKYKEPALRKQLDDIRKFIEENENREYNNKVDDYKTKQIYIVYNKTFTNFFDTKERAEEFISTNSPSHGFQVYTLNLHYI